MKKQFIVLSLAITLLLPQISFAGSGLIIKTNGLNTTFRNFSSPAGEYITKLDGQWNAGFGVIRAYASGGSSDTIMKTQDVQIFLSTLTVVSGEHIKQIGPDGADYLGVWTESGLLSDLIYNNGSTATWTFTNFTAPVGEVITGFTSSISGGYAYLNAVSSSISTGIDTPDAGNKIAFTIYPNPSSGKFIINSNGNINSIEIYNMLGEKIYSTTSNKQISNEIDLSNSPKGIYFVKIYEEENIYTEKIVVE